MYRTSDGSERYICTQYPVLPYNCLKVPRKGSSTTDPTLVCKNRGREAPMDVEISALCGRFLVPATGGLGLGPMQTGERR